MTTTTLPTANAPTGPTPTGPTPTGPTRADHSRGSSPIPTPRGRFARLGRGHPGDPAWVRPALLVLLAATGLLYLWNLSASGYANSFYAAAVQAGSTSWKAWFFGSLDPANFITVDKPPAALWVMGLSARLFGFSSWSLLVPQALEGVAAVALLSATVRRWSGPAAGLLAGAIPPVYRRLHQQQRAGPDVRLQRLRPAARRLQLRRRHRADPAVRQRDGQRDLLAAARSAGRPGRRIVAHPAYAAYRPHPGSPGAVGWVADRHRPGVQLHAGHYPPVLRGCARAGRRGPRRRRRP